MHFYTHQNDPLGELIKLNTTTCRDIGISWWKNGENKKIFFRNLQKTNFMQAKLCRKMMKNTRMRTIKKAQ